MKNFLCMLALLACCIVRSQTISHSEGKSENTQDSILAKYKEDFFENEQPKNAFLKNYITDKPQALLSFPKTEEGTRQLNETLVSVLRQQAALTLVYARIMERDMRNLQKFTGKIGSFNGIVATGNDMAFIDQQSSFLNDALRKLIDESKSRSPNMWNAPYSSLSK